MLICNTLCFLWNLSLNCSVHSRSGDRMRPKISREQDPHPEPFIINRSSLWENLISTGSGNRRHLLTSPASSSQYRHLLHSSYFTASVTCEWNVDHFQNWFEQFSIKKDMSSEPCLKKGRVHKAHKGDIISTGSHCECQPLPSTSKVTCITMTTAKWQNTLPVIPSERWYLLSLVVTDIKQIGLLLSLITFHHMQNSCWLDVLLFLHVFSVRGSSADFCSSTSPANKPPPNDQPHRLNSLLNASASVSQPARPRSWWWFSRKSNDCMKKYLCNDVLNYDCVKRRCHKLK